MNKLKAVLFDLDGTITDPKIGITKAVAYALEKYGIITESLDSLLPFIGPPLRWSFKEYFGFDKERAEEAVVYYREYYGDKGIFEATVYDGVEDLFKALKENGVKIVLATSKPTVYAKKILIHYGLIGYFDFLSGSEIGGIRDNKNEVVAYALEQCNLKPDEVVMVGDRLHDVDGAHQNDVKCIGVLYGYGSREEFSEHNADWIAESVNGLNNVIHSLINRTEFK